MLFDASSCSMFDFQYSIFDSAVFILLYMEYVLHMEFTLTEDT